MTIGERIKKQRIACRMSQEDVAKAIQVTKQAVFKYETGIVTNIPMDKIETMAQLFRVSPAYLMGWEEEEAPAADDEMQIYLEYLKNRPEMRMLFSTLKGATKEDVERAVKIIEALRGETNG